MKLSPKQYREFYIGCVNLYGIIDSTCAFKILKQYFPDAKKKDFWDDLKERSYKYFTRQYSVIKVRGTRDYLITQEMMFDEDIDSLMAQQADKPIFVPETYEEFLYYSTYDYWAKENEKELSKFRKILKRSKKDYSDIYLDIIFDDIRHVSSIPDSNVMEYIIKRLTLWKFEFATEDDFSAVVGILQNLTNNTRLFANNGFTPNELLNLRGPINPNNVSMTIGPNMKKMFESGEIDIKEYLDGIINSDLPPLVKQSLIKELKDIKFDIDKKGEA